jgi:hypothetical protein
MLLLLEAKPVMAVQPHSIPLLPFLQLEEVVVDPNRLMENRVQMEVVRDITPTPYVQVGLQALGDLAVEIMAQQQQLQDLVVAVVAVPLVQEQLGLQGTVVPELLRQ